MKGKTLSIMASFSSAEQINWSVSKDPPRPRRKQLRFPRKVALEIPSMPRKARELTFSASLQSPLPSFQVDVDVESIPPGRKIPNKKLPRRRTLFFVNRRETPSNNLDFLCGKNFPDGHAGQASQASTGHGEEGGEKVSRFIGRSSNFWRGRRGRRRRRRRRLCSSVRRWNNQ